MKFGSSDNLHCHQQQEIFHHPPKADNFLSRMERRPFGDPLMFVLLVWGVLFLILSVTLTYAQEPGGSVSQRHAAINACAAAHRTVSEKKTETVELFSAGEDPAIPQQPAVIKAASKRRAVAIQRRAKR